MADTRQSLFSALRRWLCLPFYVAAAPLIVLGAWLDPDAPAVKWKELLR